MKIKKGYLLREVSGSFFVVPIASKELDFSSLSTLNKTAAFLWKQCQTDQTKESLVAALLDHYEVDRPAAEKGVEDFVSTARASGFLEEANE